MKRHTVKVTLILGAQFAVLLFVVYVVAQNVGVLRNLGRSADALNECTAIDVALGKLLDDAGQGSLGGLFDPAAFKEASTWYAARHGVDAFEASVAVYTRAAYALLREGGGALAMRPPRNDALRPEVVQNLGTEYMALRNDPWGNPYQFFAAPWPEGWGPVVFRDWRDIVDTAQPDALTVTLTGDYPGTLGFPAAAPAHTYIWTFGGNGISDQPRYDRTHEYAPPAWQHYREDAPDHYLGGGDDINNWDTDHSCIMFYH